MTHPQDPDPHRHHDLEQWEVIAILAHHLRRKTERAAITLAAAGVAALLATAAWLFL